MANWRRLGGAKANSNGVWRNSYSFRVTPLPGSLQLSSNQTMTPAAAALTLTGKAASVS